MNSRSTGSRTYHSTRRARGAAETRKSILEAATGLFVLRGYGAVTVGEIAEEAGTAVPTVYASTGGKSAILNTIIEEEIADPIVDETLEAIRNASSAKEVIAETAHGTRRDNERHHDMIAVLRSAAAVDEAARETQIRSNEIYRDTLAKTVDRLMEIEALAPGLDRERAVGILWFYFGHHAWTLHVDDLALSWDETERWLCSQATSALLGQS